jgi:FMN phosphatase YigB (HAD superfamily)
MNTIQTEEEFIRDQWQEHFAPLENEEIVIYGIGKNTRNIIADFPEANIVALMDEQRVGDEIYGKRIIDIEEVISFGVKKIIIVSRFSNLKIIYRRIAEKARMNGINVYDINGNLIDDTRESPIIFPEKKYDSITKENLKNAILTADVISFDIFDTLIMRDVLYPRDIFLALGKDFAKKRIIAEEGLYREGKHPNIYQIYDRMEGEYSPETEIETELKHLHPKPVVCEFLKFAEENGKKVFLTSDMYLPKNLMSKFLSACDIDFSEEDIIVSCDAGVSKYNGLFEILKKRAATDNILHIGDNIEADINSAKRAGIKAFYLPSSQTTLEDSIGEKLFRFADNLSNRRLIGYFLYKFLENPFLFSETKGKFLIQNDYEMSAAFFAPLILKIFGFLISEARHRNLDVVLLASRDGFIIEKIYNIYKEKYKLPEMRYFYISRSAAVMAYIKDETGIQNAVSLGYSGSAEELLKIRFFLNETQILTKNENENDVDYILRHSNIIIKTAEKHRENFRKYISKLNIKSGAKIGFFDFVSIGTCIGCLSSFSDLNLTGLLVGKPFVENSMAENVQIATLFDIEYNIFKNSNSVIDNYVMWENILTSPEPSLERFDENGDPVFCDEDRSDQSLNALEEIHTAVLDYVNELDLTADEISEISPNLVCEFFELLKQDFTVLKTDYFEREKLRDKFCNREFSLERN